MNTLTKYEEVSLVIDDGPEVDTHMPIMPIGSEIVMYLQDGENYYLTIDGYDLHLDKNFQAVRIIAFAHTTRDNPSRNCNYSDLEKYLETKL